MFQCTTFHLDLSFYNSGAYLAERALWQRSLKKLRTLKKSSTCVKFGKKLTHFEKFFRSALNLGPIQSTLKIFF